MNVLLVGVDVAQSFAFTFFEEALKAGGIEVMSILGRGKPVSGPHWRDLVDHADVVLTGLSASRENAEAEVAAADAARASGTPYGFYADTYGVHERPWFEHLRNDATFIFVLNEEEAERARPMYPNARVVASGNPTWEKFFFPAMSRDAVRDRLSVSSEERLIFVPGGTILDKNLFLLAAVVTTLSGYAELREKKWHVVFGVHPGDQSFVRNPSIYDAFRAWSAFPFDVAPRDRISGSDILPGADIVIDCGTTLGIEAAHLRKDVICYLSDAAIRDLRTVIGSDVWPPCEKGVMHLVRGTDGLAEALGMDFSRVHERQQIVYPSPREKGASARAVTETLIAVGESRR